MACYVVTVRIKVINIVENKHERFVKRVANINPDIEIIGQFVKNRTKVLCRCTIHDITWEAYPQSLLRGSGCSQCGREKMPQCQPYTKEKFISLIKDKVPNVDIIGDYLNRDTKILVRCKKDGYEWLANPKNLQNGEGCPLCSNNVVVTGINDIATTHPQIVKYFKDKTETKKYTYGSKHRTTFVCPVCHNEKVDYIHNVSRNGFVCSYCDSSISFPSKLLKGLMLQLPVENVVYEYSPDWAGRYRYDAYFEYSGSSYVVEMDGGFHYRTGIGGYYSQKGLEATQSRDNSKDILAKAHGIIMIRIDCNRSKADYIIKRIKNSIIADLFDLSIINWDRIVYDNESKLKEICDCYNASETKTAKEVSEKLGYDRHSVSKYLQRGCQQNLCDYNANYNSNYNNAKHLIGINVETNEEFEFNGYTDCVRQIREITNRRMSINTLKKRISANKEYNGYLFKVI